MSNSIKTPERNGNSLQDPFADDISDGPKGKKGNKHEDSDVEADHGERTPTLFYAYARRTDNHWASRYLVTFASASVCAEWWSLVQSEYPDQGTRHGPQLFSFQGDDFLLKPSTSKKFEHLKTQWFYSQFGDASGTGGRAQEIIPLQDWDGKIVTGGSAGESLNNRSNLDKGKGKAPEEVDDEDDKETIRNGDSGFDFSGLADSLQSTKFTAEMNNAQIAQLTESQSYSQEQLDRDQDRLFRLESLVQQTAEQLQTLSESHVKAQQQNRELAEQNAKILRELKRQRTQAQKLFEQAQKVDKAELNRIKKYQAAANNSGPDGEKEAGEMETANVVVHPPPRKIDRPLVGYAYQSGQNSPAKASPARRPVEAGGKTVSTARTGGGGGGK